MKAIEGAKTWAKKIKRDGLTLWFASRDARTPWYAKALGAFVVAYALSPIDLIPDFIPIFGYLDDIILLPVLIWLTLKVIPAEVLQESRSKATEWEKGSSSKPRSYVGAAVVLAIWTVLAAALALWIFGATPPSPSSAAT